MKVMSVQKQIPIGQQIWFKALIIVDNDNDQIVDALLGPQLKDEKA